MPLRPAPRSPKPVSDMPTVCCARNWTWRPWPRHRPAVSGDLHGALRLCARTGDDGRAPASVSQRPAPGRSPLDPAARIPLVGREQELACLAETWQSGSRRAVQPLANQRRGRRGQDPAGAGVRRSAAAGGVSELCRAAATGSNGCCPTSRWPRRCGHCRRPWRLLSQQPCRSGSLPR